MDESEELPRAQVYGEVTSFGAAVPLVVSASPRGGRGVFAGAAIAEGQEVEVCPVLALQRDHIAAECAAMRYFFGGEHGDVLLCVLGYGMLYNHAKAPVSAAQGLSKDFANLTYALHASPAQLRDARDGNVCVRFVARRRIQVRSCSSITLTAGGRRKVNSLYNRLGKFSCLRSGQGGSKHAKPRQTTEIRVQGRTRMDHIKHEAQKNLKIGLYALVDSAGELLKPWQRAEEVGLQEGSSVTAVVRCAHLFGDRTARGFAVLKADGGVVAWGHPSYGGDSRRAAPQLKDVAKVFANCGAFAAIRCDGTVVTGGHPNCGGNCRKVQAQLQEVWHICPGNVPPYRPVIEGAFAAIRNDGHVVTWGSPGCGGDSGSVSARLRSVCAVRASCGAFAALRTDGSVVCWGSDLEATNVQDLKELRSVKCLYSNLRSFAALRHDGRVVTWGCDVAGGNSDDVQDELCDVCDIAAVDLAFAAIRSDGSVVTWGNPKLGSNISAVKSQLFDVQQICGTASSFAALRSDGRVVTWGQAGAGGESSQVQDQLYDVRQVVAAESAFCALRWDGRVVTWGRADIGGDSGAVQSQLRDVVSICSSRHAFSALRADGQVISWGRADHGGEIPASMASMDVSAIG